MTILSNIHRLCQVPCRHDRAVFPAGMTYKVSVLQSPVSVSRVSISGHSLDSVGLRSFLRTQVGRTMFNVSQGIRVTGGQCEDRRGCECGTAHLEQEICGHVSGKDHS